MRGIDFGALREEMLDDSLHQIRSLFLKRDKGALLENVGPNGEFMDSIQGRCVNPGHAIENAWVMMHEGMHRNDQSLIDDGLWVLDRSIELGWDRKYGGIFHFIDIENKPPLQREWYEREWWDMKVWWVHTEAIYALLLAYYLTNRERYLKWFDKVHDWSFKHFPDHRYGEWFGFLSRDGMVENRLKGSLFKGPFHLSRAMLQSMKVLEKMEDSGLRKK
jgi:N-acylglucosamine 2-epimerase